MKIYKFKNGTLSEKVLKGLTFTEALKFGITKAEYETVVNPEKKVEKKVEKIIKPEKKTEEKK